mmetsp:Transcript_81058/g.194460  ORF Transcript_81058/g.194460 Transcript_81058/m.194460 type:complete len:327 (+) Transcript_81058:250-1230(+)
MDVGSPRGVVQHADALDQACHPSSGFQVAQVRLGAGLQNGTGPVCTHDPSQGSDLNRISQRSSCSVALGDGDTVGGQASLPHGLSNDFLLRWAVWRRHGGAAAVLIDAAADQHGNSARGFHGILTDLQLDGAHALSSSEAIRRVVKSEAPSLVRKHARSAQGDVATRTQEQVAPNHEAVLQVRGDVGRLLIIQLGPHRHLRNARSNQAGRAGRLGRGGRTGETEDVREPIRRCRALPARQLEVQVLAHRVVNAIPVGAGIPAEDAALPVLQLASPVPGIVQGLVAHLQHDSHVRRHLYRLPLVDAEELVVEHLDFRLLKIRSMAGH